MSNAQKSNATPLLFAAGLALVSLSGAVFFLLQPQSGPDLVERALSVPETTREASSSPSRPHTGAATPAPVERGPRAKPNRMARDLDRERIWEALSERHGLQPAAAGSAAPSSSAASLLPSLDQEYIRAVMKEQLVPVAQDCYNTALGRDPKLGGTLVLKFTIIGSEDIGGVVEDAEIGRDSTLASEFMRECLRESTMALTFDPPPDGGRVEVSYPLTFEPGDDD